MIGENEANVGIASFSMFSISRLGSQMLSSSVHAVFLLSSWTHAVAGTFSSYVISLPFFTHWVTYHCGVPTQGVLLILVYRDIFGYIRVIHYSGWCQRLWQALQTMSHPLDWPSRHWFRVLPYPRSRFLYVDVFFDALRGLCTVWAVINAFISVSGDRKMIFIYDIENLSGCGGDFVCSCVWWA